MKKALVKSLAMLLFVSGILTGCAGSSVEPDDYATNEGYSIQQESSVAETETTESDIAQTEEETKLTKDNIKVGVLYISDPGEGSGYSYTHDLGIIGMQANLGLSSDQIIRKIVDDTDAAATRKAIEECIAEGCNVIFTTSWGYMETTAEMAEEYPDLYFSHGTGYLSNGSNFNNYFGRIYQARYLSGIVAGMNTTTNKIGYVAAMDSSNSEVTGGIRMRRSMLWLQTAGTIRRRRKRHHVSCWIWAVMLWHSTVIHRIRRHWHRNTGYTESDTIQI